MKVSDSADKSNAMGRSFRDRPQFWGCIDALAHFQLPSTVDDPAADIAPVATALLLSLVPPALRWGSTGGAHAGKYAGDLVAWPAPVLY